MADNKIPNLQKNDEIEAQIIDYGTDGEGIAKKDGFTIFVKGALKGEKAIIHITKVLTNFAYANVKEILEKSPYRVEKDCNTFPRCGGCMLRHIEYSETLKIKQEKVQNLFDKTFRIENKEQNIDCKKEKLNNEIEKNNSKNTISNEIYNDSTDINNENGKIIVNPTIGMDNPFYYRNKAIYPVSLDKKVGIYASRSHNIVPIDECKIQTLESQQIAKYIVENWCGTIYNEKTGNGLLRNIMIREGFKTGEIMCVLVQNGTELNTLDVEKLLKTFPKIKTVVVNVNTKNTNVVLSNKNIVLYGDGYITDILGGYKFRISPNSFYQINPLQTEKIYKIAIEKANLNKDDILCDLYCGIGTIGIFASKYVKKVYGIEIVPEAIKDAKINAQLNNIDNIEFIEGDVETAFSKLLKQQGNKNKKKIDEDYLKNIENIEKSKAESKDCTVGMQNYTDSEMKINHLPNAVIVDPPRKGLDSATIENLKKLNLQKLVYVSCNPATLVRDLKELSEIYEIKDVTPVDNFCYSSHVETIASLARKSTAD